MGVYLLKHKIRFIGFCIMLAVVFMLGCISNGNSSTSPSVEDRYALIYNGPVAAEDCPEAVAAIAEPVGLQVKFVSDISELPWLLKHAAVFIIGGTEDDISPLIKAFNPDVTKALKDYLRNGGHYLGICGGGYMASTGWEEGKSFVKTLGIISAESSDFSDNWDPQILQIRWLGKIHPMYFQYGPAFDIVPDRETVQVIAYYADGRIAALMSSYGKGKVAVCGPHPEARESWSEEAANGDAWTSTTDLACDLLKELLSDSPVKR